MILYNYIRKTHFKNNDTYRTDTECTDWNKDREKIIEKINEDKEWAKHYSKYWEVIDYIIVEKDFTEPVTICGIVGDNGNSYEDFEVTVGGIELYNFLYKRFEGNNIKLTIEIQ
jgi:hypothetical protein